MMGVVQAAAESEAAARDAGLRYVSDQNPGIRRRRFGRTFAYVHPDGRPVREAGELARIRSLAIPPAYEDVWICPIPNGHVQATARDARGRKQYRYHKRWREVRDEAKYHRMVAFAKALPKIRAGVARDLRAGKPSLRTVLAAVVAILDMTGIRVGNEEYAQANDSYGLTTLRTRHVRTTGSKIRVRFRGKTGKEHLIAFDDARLARIIKRCRDLPGEELFAYVRDDGTVDNVSSDDVNAYIRELASDQFSAKDFRTWIGTVACMTALAEPAANVTDAKHNVVTALQSVAGRLGNTAAVCRKAYVHPSVIETYQRDLRLPAMRERARATKVRPATLSTRERFVLRFIERAEAEELDPVWRTPRRKERPPRAFCVLADRAS
jgi:DNA topoisomerase I